MKQHRPTRMQCMEVWGGNHSVTRSVETAGLRIWVYSRPFGKAHRGGDVHYVSSCASGRITRLLLADVSGHGETVAQVAVALRDLMRKNVNYIKQSRFVQAMNQQFAEFGKNDLFATALVGTFFAPPQSFTLCNAGHPVPLMFCSEKSEWSELRSNRDSTEHTNLPFGIIQQASYGQVSIKLRKGDLVLSFSDSVTESEDGHGRQLGSDGILRLARELPLRAPELVIPRLLQRLASLAEDNLQRDDTTMLLIQATGGRPTLQNNLLAPFRLFGPVADKTNLS